MVIILAGIFGEMENFHFLDAIVDGKLIFKDG
jgi:hypothetical protein